jgi:hypothetical protein
VIRVGLRFDRRDAWLLHSLADRVRAGDLGRQAATTFEYAAQAAETGEPLIVLCEHSAEEAVLMAAGYTQFGVTHPAIEELTGDRPAR